MNSEDRHRLETNELGVAVQSAGHWLEVHATKIVVAICGVLLVAAAVIWWSRQTDASAMKAWSQLEDAETVDELGLIADEYKGTPAGRWAKLRGSELYLKTGLDKVFTDRELGLQDLKKARDGFEELANDKTIDQPILERALWGLALSLESTSDGDTAKAAAAYQRLLDEIPETYFKPFAEERVAKLKKGGAAEFYTWFSKENPKPAESRPKDGALKGFDDLPFHDDKTDIGLPDLLKRPDDKKPGTKSPDAKGEETPEKSDPEKPKDPTADPDKPKEPADKQDEKPADSKEGDKPKANDSESKPEPKPEEKKE